MDGIVVVNNGRRNRVDAVCDTDDELTIVKPSIGNLTQCSRDGRSERSCKRNLTAFANIGIGNSQIDGRHREHSNLNITVSGATGVGLVDFNSVGGGRRNRRGVSGSRGTRNFRTIGLPHIRQVICIVVGNISRQRDLTICTDHCIRSSDNNLDISRIIHIDIERITDSRATGDAVRSFHRENVRVVAARILFA